MSKKADVINLERLKGKKAAAKKLQLDSGRYILICSKEKEELLEIVDGGEVVVTVRLTDEGPVVTVQGAHLELKSTETLALEAKEVKIKAEEKVSVESRGRLKIDSAKKMDIHSEDDIRVVGKIIHLN
jgi:uncharacterized protein (DUF2345 family)